jgi:hypothetical protein
MSILKIKKIFFWFILLVILNACKSKSKTNWELLSPDGTIKVTIDNTLKDSMSLLSYRVERIQGDSLIEIIGRSPLGIIRKDNSFYKNLEFIGEKKNDNIEDSYALKSGKALHVKSISNEMILQFKNIEEQPINIIFRTYDDGIAFRYKFPNKDSLKYKIIQELSGFKVSQQKAWIQQYDTVSKYTPAYEKMYKNGIALKDQSAAPNGWCFPALFQTNKNWVLLTESNLEPSYFGAHLSKQDKDNVFTIQLPLKGEAMGVGEIQPISTLPWTTPWRTIIIGESLGTIIESDMVTNLSKPNVLKETDWIKPGRASWSWWSSVAVGRNLDTLVHFVDLAAKMKWEYSLVDANWNLMPKGEMDSLVSYANSKNIGLLLWYNSGGKHNIVTEEPRDLMFDAVQRKIEFKRISKLGIKGIKVDFFQSDKPFIIQQYIGILEDAAAAKLLVNFHGCTIPRGWRRTYPNLVSMESIMGAENYRYSQEFAEYSPMLNTISVATRNVIGPMDYTPVTFSKSNYQHLTSYGHELALSVVFESGITHFADKVSAFENMPKYVQYFLKIVPVASDEIKYLEGIPGKDMVLARRKGTTWYIGGINGENKDKKFTINIADFTEDTYEVTQIIDGKTNTEFAHKTGKLNSATSFIVEMLPYGGFVVVLRKSK